MSIPDSPKDNFDSIIEHSRANFARPRAEVEAEIRETIEQSEKYKKELSDSGRQEEIVFAPIQRKTASESPVMPTNTTILSTEQKPNLKRPATPQADLRRSKLSPNAAEGKERLGLKDLAKLVAEKEEEPKKGNEPAKKASRFKKGNKKAKKQESTPVVPASSPTPVSSPVKPEVVYQEKTAVEIYPSHENLPLNTPVKRTDNYANKDNSVDGFLAIRHEK